jgi:hypothetical protein
MSDPASKLPAWVDRPPNAYDIVTAYFPESKPRPGDQSLRPCLVTRVLKADDAPGEYACEVVFGTKHLKIMQRQFLDVIVQNHEHMTDFGLAMATRFDLDSHATLPWTPQFFGCWRGKRSPVIGSLTSDYVKDYAFKMLRRLSVPPTRS